MFRSRSRITVSALAALTAVGLAACSGSGSDPAPSRSSSSTAPIVSPSIAPTTAQHAIPSDRSIVEVPALRKTITLTTCKASSGGWTAGGSARNTSSARQTYHLLVFFTDRYSRTIDFARGEVAVAPGRTGTWTASKTFTPPAGTQCVLRGLYAS